MPALTSSQNGKKATLADVARYAGVSSAVVSYVVNNGPRPVAIDTANRVRQAIDMLGYRPNSQARALRNGSTGILGLIHPGTGNPFFGEYNDVIYESARRANLALLTANSAGNAATEAQLREDLAGRNVDGLVIVTSLTQRDISGIRDPRVPTLFLNCPFPIPGFPTVGPAAVAGARRIVDHLFDHHGHSDVALIAGATSSKDPEERERGWRESVHSHSSVNSRMVRAPFTLRGGYTAVQDLLASGPAPSALFVSSDLQAFGALHALHEQGLRIPDDVAVASFDGTTESAHTWPPLTVVQQPLEQMANAAIETLLAGRTTPAHEEFEMQLVPRESCGCKHLL